MANESTDVAAAAGELQPLGRLEQQQMIKPRPNPDAVIRELFKLCGGVDKTWRRFHEGYSNVVAAWEQDTETIGRILRAHLFVEHFLTEYLAARTPELADIQEARLSFAQKVALIAAPSDGVAYLRPGLLRLNAIRNRLAHTLHSEVSTSDATVFLSIGLFRAMREAQLRPNVPSSDPINILDDFARHAGLALHASASGNAMLFAEAFHRAKRKSIRTRRTRRPNKALQPTSRTKHKAGSKGRSGAARA